MSKTEVDRIQEQAWIFALRAIRAKRPGAHYVRFPPAEDFAIRRAAELAFEVAACEVEKTISPECQEEHGPGTQFMCDIYGCNTLRDLAARIRAMKEK